MAAISRGTIRLFTVYDTCSYPTLSKFSFAIQESTLSDKMYLIENVVSPHCGDKKKMARRCMIYFLRTSFSTRRGVERRKKRLKTT